MMNYASERPARKPLTPAMIRSLEKPSATSCDQATQIMHALTTLLQEEICSFAGAPAQVEMDGISVGVQPAGPSPSHISHRFSLSSDRGSLQTILVADRVVVMGLCELAFGGSGIEPPFDGGERPFSKAEQELVGALMESFSSRLSGKLGELLGPVFAVQAQDTVKPGRADASLSYRSVRLLTYMFGYSGDFAIYFSEGDLDNMLATVGEKRDSEHSRPVAAFREALYGSPIQLLALLPPESRPLAEVADLRLGQLLRLNATATSPIYIAARGRTLRRAALVPGNSTIRLEVAD